MAATIRSKISRYNSTISNTYYDQGFRNLFLDHIGIINGTTAFTIKSIPLLDQYRYQYNLVGLLKKYGIEEQYHWFVMVMSGMVKYEDYDVGMTYLKLPNVDYISTLRSHYLTNKKVPSIT
jgi:hypothetical protein